MGDIKAVKFIEQLKHTKGKWRGVNFDLLPWQNKIITDVFGTLKPNGMRQYNFAYVEVPKKNGKSELGAGVGLYLTCGDGEWGAEVYGCAADRAQASIVFDVAVDMVDQCPALKKRIKLVASQKRMIYLPTRSFYQVLSAESFSKHGLNVHGVIFDELHAQPSRDLYDVMTQGSGDAREQPLYWVITTAGDDPDRGSIGWEVHEKAQGILDGTTIDPTFYASIYGLPEEADPWDEANWYAANPSLGTTIDIDKVRAHAIRAKQSPMEEKNFRWLRLNQWVKVRSSGWMNVDDWDTGGGLVVPERLKGRRCYGGLDLSSKLDITAFVLVFPPEKEGEQWQAMAWFWIPSDNWKERLKEGVPYDKWIKNGYVTATDGNVIDYRHIMQMIMALRDEFDIQEIGYDPWNAMQVAVELQDAGIDMVEVRQGYKTMSPAMKTVEELVRSGQLNHGGNPVLRWMAGNVEVKQDENENIRPVKLKQRARQKRIDGIVALINAMARASVHESGSVYDDREIRELG